VQLLVRASMDSWTGCGWLEPFEGGFGAGAWWWQEFHRILNGFVFFGEIRSGCSVAVVSQLQGF
jgi:hypothetical protein